MRLGRVALSFKAAVRMPAAQESQSEQPFLKGKTHDLADDVST